MSIKHSVHDSRGRCFLLGYLSADAKPGILPYMSYLPEILTVALIHLLAVISPGPDFAALTRNALRYSQKAGFWTAAGLATGILVHVTYSLIGIGYIIASSIVLFSILKTVGACYLFYIGWKMLKSKSDNHSATITQERKSISAFAAYKMGFLTNVLNPKATLLFFSLFSQVVSVTTPLSIKVIMGAEMSVVTFLWFGFLSLVISRNVVRKTLNRFQHQIERFTGAVLILFGVRLALSKVR